MARWVFRIAAFGALVFLDGARVAAQTDSSFRAISYDNLHIAVPDPPAAARWYVTHLGARAAVASHRVYFGNTVLVFVKREKAGPSAGSVIDHFALSFTDATSRLESARKGGATLGAGDAIDSVTAGFLIDPWGVTVEIVQDTRLLGFHHVHLRLPESTAGLAWYQKMLGGEPGKLGGISGVRYGPTWLLASDSKLHPPAASADRAIQCVAWRVDSRDRAVTVLSERGVKVVSSGVSTVEGQQVPWAYVEDSHGVRIELLQRPATQ